MSNGALFGILAAAAAGVAIAVLVIKNKKTNINNNTVLYSQEDAARAMNAYSQQKQKEAEEQDWFSKYMAYKDYRVKQALEQGIDPWTLPIT